MKLSLLLSNDILCSRRTMQNISNGQPVASHEKALRKKSHLDHLIHGLYHQVDINVCFDSVISKGLAHHGTDREVGDIVVV